MQEKIIAQLTKYPSGSMKEFLSICIPIMLAASSNSIMFNVDRIMVAKYSIEALNGVALGSIAAATYQFAAVAIALIAEVFVGQYNGSKQYKKVAKPVWQMIAFSFACILLFVPIGYFSANFYIPLEYRESGVVYFRYMMYFGFLDPLIVAIASFFIGTGRPGIVSLSVLIGSLVNILLNYILIYGITNQIPAMGAEGAAIATVISKTLQVIFLFRYFYTKANKEKYAVNKIKLEIPMLKNCFKFGVPSALNNIIEITAWNTLYLMMTGVSRQHVLLTTISQSIYMLFAFAHNSLQKTMSALSANYLGSKQINFIDKSLRTSYKFVLFFILLISIPFIGKPDLVIKLFSPDNISIKDLEFLKEFVPFLSFSIVIIIGISGLAWSTSGVLIAGGDTAFVMWTNSINVWLFVIIPSYFLVVKGVHTMNTVWVFSMCYNLMNFILMRTRYSSNTWRKLDVSKI